MGTDRLIYIRTDGNKSIATGHLVRCLSIADACLSLGMKICFLVSDKESKMLLQSFDPMHKFPVQVLKTAAYDDLEKELPEVLDLLSSSTTKNSIYFLDSYYVTPKYLSSIKAIVPITYLDDLQLFDYAVDLVINYDVIPGEQMSSYENACQNAAHALLGASYTPLRSQFRNKKAPIRNQVANILITTGGSDPYHFCLKLIDAFQKKQICSPSDSSCPDFYLKTPIQLQIVVGRLNEDKAILYKLEKKLSFIHLHENVSDMASLMMDCDLAVSAAGTTLYELCSVGLPAVSYTMADNQITSAKAFADAGAIPCAGDIRISYESVLDFVVNFVTYMSENCEQRKSAQNNMRRLVDGQGALRIADALSRL